MATKTLKGVYAFNATPTKDDGDAVDEIALKDLAEFVLNNGVHGVCIFGSTGSNGSFTSAERLSGAKAAVEQVKGRIQVMTGIGSITTKETVELAKAMENEAGVDSLLVVPITYWPLTQDEVYEHYERVAAATKLPIALYNNPWTTGVDMLPPLVERLFNIDNIVAIKESTSNLVRISEIKRLTKGKMTVFSGWESLTLESLAAGAEGWFAGMSNVAPRECVELYDLAVEKKDLAGAQALFDRIFPLCEFMCQKSHVRCAHAALEIMGRPVGPPRRPIRELGAEDKAELKRLMEECGILTAYAQAAE